MGYSCATSRIWGIDALLEEEICSWAEMKGVEGWVHPEILPVASMEQLYIYLHEGLSFNGKRW